MNDRAVLEAASGAPLAPPLEQRGWLRLTPVNRRRLDNFRRNHRLGLIFEAQVGAGRCLVCSADLPGHRDQPAPRQLLGSLLAYMASESFQPAARLDAGTLARLLGDAPGAASA